MYAIEEMGARALIVGQAPSKLDDPAHPITGRTGRRLANLLGMKFDDFLAGFDRANLIDRWHGRNGGGDRFDKVIAGRGAYHLHCDHLRTGKYNSVLLLGRNVARSVLGLSTHGWMRWGDYFYTEYPGGRIRYFSIAILPHPSGLNRWWNDLDNENAARRFLGDWREQLCRSWEQRENQEPARRP